VLIGEAPGANEDKQGMPFVGTAGKVLNLCLRGAGLARDDIMVMNTIACRPPKNRNPEVSEREACRPHFDKQLGLSSAYVMVLMGKQAHAAVTGDDDFRLGDVRGKPFWMDGRVMLTTYHPAYVARQRDAQGILVADLQIARDITRSSKWWPEIEPADITTLGAAGPGFAQRVSKQGIVRLYSPRLKDTILVLEHGDVSVPEKWKHLPRYTMPELVKLGETAQQRGMSVKDLRTAHLVKAQFGGEIVT
jgi:uracil-DNA glycosylase family 4